MHAYPLEKGRPRVGKSDDLGRGKKRSTVGRLCDLPWIGQATYSSFFDDLPWVVFDPLESPLSTGGKEGLAEGLDGDALTRCSVS